jgi:hypothetical protein
LDFRIARIRSPCNGLQSPALSVPGVAAGGKGRAVSAAMLPFEPMMPIALTAGLGLLLACTVPPDPAVPLRVTRSSDDGSTRLTLVASPGIRINAQLKPALELPDGTALRFDSPHLTPDSAYFTEPPTVRVEGPWRGLHGTLKASICGEEPTCRPFVQEVSLPAAP